MYMTLFEQILLQFMFNKKVKVEVVGFDMNAFSRTICREMRERLETVSPSFWRTVNFRPTTKS